MEQVFVIRDAGQFFRPANRGNGAPAGVVFTDCLATLKELARRGAEARSLESVFDLADLSEIDETSERIAQSWHALCEVEFDRDDGWPLERLGEFDLLNFGVPAAIKSVVLIDCLLKKWNPERVYYDPRILRLHQTVRALPEPLRSRFASLGAGQPADGGDSLMRGSPNLGKRIVKATLAAAGRLAGLGRAALAKQVLLVTDSTHEDLWQFYRRWPNVLATSATLPRSPRTAVRLLLEGRVLNLPDERRWCKKRMACKSVAPGRGSSWVLRGIDLFPILREDFERVASECAGYWSSVATAVECELRCRRVGIVVLPTDTAPLHRLLALAAHRLGIPAIVLQHGSKEYPVDAHDMGTAKFAAVWGDWVRQARLARYTQLERIFVVGAPHLDKYFGRFPRNGRRQRARGGAATALVLPQSFYRMSAFSDRMHDDRFLDFVLPGLAARPEIGRVIVKPHPAVRRGHIESVIRDLGCQNPRVKVCYGKLEHYLAGEPVVVVCANSTGWMEAIAAGLPVICANVTRRTFSPPLDGRSGIPVVTTERELALALDQVLARRRAPPSSDFEPYIGPLDGQSIARATLVVRHLLEWGGASSKGAPRPTIPA